MVFSSGCHTCVDIDQCDALFYDRKALKDFVIKLIEDKSS